MACLKEMEIWRLLRAPSFLLLSFGNVCVAIADILATLARLGLSPTLARLGLSPTLARTTRPITHSGTT
ncbi:hypothetical protein AALO_G00089070, partial [Alosa alosa]